MKWLLGVGMAVLHIATGASSEKIYLTPDQVYVGAEGILVDLQGDLHSVRGLFRDSQGLHVMSQELVDEHTFSWTCPRGHSSPGGTGMCNDPDCPFRKRQ
jgi:hypothetical protein